MRTTHVVRSLIGAALIVGLAPSAGAQPAADVSAARAVFTARIQQYAWLRGRLEEPLPLFEERRSSWSLFMTRRYLASAIRSARPHARLGTVFAPPVDRMFRDLMMKTMYEVDVEGLGGFDEELAVDVAIHETVPEWALGPVPEALLARLPQLPQAIEYRVVSGALVLWDVHAEIVIDALPNAFVEQ
jgi:hypothetical protein